MVFGGHCSLVLGTREKGLQRAGTVTERMGTDARGGTKIVARAE